MAEKTTAFDYQEEDRLHEAIASFEQARDAGAVPDPRQWLDRYPEVAGRLAEFFADQNELRRRLGDGLPDARPGQVAPPEMAPQVPDYEIAEEVGRGGMGVVYKARQLSANRIVALKVIRADRLEQPSPEERRKAVERFVTEAQAAARLEHESIVNVYDVGEVGGRPFYSMRFVEGSSLHDLRKPGPLESRRAAAYMAAVARAVHDAHRHGILHRDLKPHNILVEARGDRPLVADFGLAKLLQGGAEITRTGDVMGTPPYMSPEQAQGSASLTVASDVYSLGATLYALLTGRPPFQGDDPVQTLRRVVEDEPAPPRILNPDVDRDLETICLKCLEKEPRKRYASAEEVADRLQLFLEGKPIPDRPITRAERLWRWCRRNPLLAATGCIAAAGIIAVVTLSISFAIHANRAAENESQAATDLRDALGDAKTERRLAQDRLVNLEVTAGVRLMDEGDLLGSLAWFAKALEEEKGGPERERIHRMRLGAIWQQCPRLLQLWLHEGPVNHAEFSHDGRQVVTASDDNTVRVWDVQSGQLVTAPLKHNSVVRHAAFSSGGRWLVTATCGNTARVWDAQSGQPVTPPLKHNSIVFYAAFSPDGRRVVTASGDHTARVWNAQSGQPVTAPLKHNGRVWHVVFSPDGGRVLTTSDDRTARVWDAQSGQPVTGPLKHNSGHYHAVFSPDGGRVLTASDDRTARVWDAQSGQPVTGPLKHNVLVWHAAFSPDGQRIVTASGDQTARVWDAQSGQPVTPPLKHNASVLHAAFSPDGQRVVTASHDRTARVWDAQSGQPVTGPLKHNGGVKNAAFSPDGRRVVTVSDDQTARVWDLPSGDRPVEDWRLLAELVTGQRMDASEGFAALEPKALAELWQTLRAKYPSDFAISAKEAETSLKEEPRK
jgi:WD40 repeat protein